MVYFSTATNRPSTGGMWSIIAPPFIQRRDGKLVTIYYFTTVQLPEMHIAATIWDPAQMRP